MSQSILNIPQLEADKIKASAIIKELYAELNSYADTAKSPISITGLTELNAAVGKTNAAFAQMSSTISQLTITLKQYGELSKTVSVDEQRQSSLSKQAAADKKRLEKELLEIKKASAAEDKRLNAQKLADEKALRQQQKQDAAAIEAAEKRAYQLRQRNFELQAQLRKREQAEQRKLQAEKDKFAADEAKKLLLQNNEYTQLILKIKQLEAEYSRLYAAGKGNTPAAQGMLAQLREANAVSSQIDANLLRAGSNGAANLGRSLTSALSGLRQIAYILPGIGLAGLFNLAFEAIAAAGDALFDFTNHFEKLIEYQKAYVEQLTKSNTLLSDQSDLLKRQQTASDVAYAQRQKELSDAGGINPTGAFGNDRDINQQLKRESDNQVAVLNASYDKQSVLLTKLFQLNQQKEKYAQGVKIGDERVKELEAINVPVRGLIQGTLEKKGKIAGAKEFRDTNQKAFETTDAEYKAVLELYTKSSDALKNAAEVDAAIKAQSLKEDKYYYDQKRAIVLDNIETEVNKRKKLNDLVLSNQLSTEAERKAAVESNLVLEKRLSLAKLNYELSDKSVDDNGAEKNKARNNYNQETINDEKDAKRELSNIEKEFYLRSAQTQESALQEEITLNQIRQEEIFKNDKAGYIERLDAYTKYIEFRKLAIQKDFEFDVDKIQKTVPKDLQAGEIKLAENQRDKKLFEVTQGSQEAVYAIVDSFYKKQLKLIEENDKARVDETLDSQTAELKALNDAYDAKLIKLKKFQREKQKLLNEDVVKTDKSNIEDDKTKINELLSLKDELDFKIQGATDKFINGATPDEQEQGFNELEKLFESEKDLDFKIIDGKKKLSVDLNKLEKDRNKQTEENRKQLNANLILLEKQLFDTIKSIVDAQYEQRIQRSKEQQAIYDENVDREKDAIDRSTLNQKDKNAYEIQLAAQKTAADKKFADEQKKIEHDKAVFDRDIDIAQIITATALAVANTLKVGGAFSIPLAVTVGALGAVALAKAVATSIPAYAEGGVHEKAGFALYGEAGHEIVAEPNKKPYIATKPTIGWLESGTKLIPMYDSPNISEKKYKDDSWAQTQYLANAINKGNKKTRNVVKANINISFKDMDYKNKILHG